MDDIRWSGAQHDVEKFLELHARSDKDGGLQADDAIALQAVVWDLALAAPWLVSRVRELEAQISAAKGK